LCSRPSLPHRDAAINSAWRRPGRHGVGDGHATLGPVPTTERVTGGTLAVLAALQAAWGAGACFAVAAALAAGAALVLDTPPVPGILRRPGLLGLAGILGLRGVVGLAGRTASVSPGSDAPRFVRLDRRVYSPVCLGLSAGSLAAWRSAAR
jgi:hypothetical protein